jgi:CheY-like chemotaxis protein
MGFAAYLVKPIRQSSLAERVRAKTEMIVPAAPHDLAPLPQTQLLDAGRGTVSTGARAPDQPSSDNAVPPETTHTLRILLVEDNPINALLTRELLRRRGHEVKDVRSGEAALDSFNAERFDLVITDIHMPGLDGIETTQRIRSLEARHGRARIPILALTADALEVGQRACEDAGMDGYLTKPVDPVELDAILARLFPDAAKDAAA